MKTISITIDTEPDFGGYFKKQWEAFDEKLPEVLDIFDEYGVKATFFVEAETLLKKLKNIKMLQRKGHEIASHGFGHIKLTEDNIADQMVKVKEAFHKADIVPKGFRSPYLMPNRTLAKHLSENGFKYDSSLVKAWFPGRYNYWHVPSNPYHPSFNNIEVRPFPGESPKPFIEFPVSRIPLTFSAFSLLQSSIRRPSRRWWNDIDNAVFYFHFHDIKPWPNEVLRQLPWYMQIINRFSKYHMKTLRKLIEGFPDREFVKMEELV